MEPLLHNRRLVPRPHDPAGGQRVPAERLADALLDPAYPRDGTLPEGEPFAQPRGLLAPVRAPRALPAGQVAVTSRPGTTAGGTGRGAGR